MHLSTYTDYALRVLIYLAVHPERQLTQIKEISGTFHTSHHHITKIVHELGRLGFIETVRGRGGGIRLAKNPKEIHLGQVVRLTEEHFHIAECFSEERDACIISPSCHLKHALKEALNAYLQVLDRYTLADVTVNSRILKSLLATS